MVKIREHVLVVDNQENWKELLQILLESMRCKVTFADKMDNVLDILEGDDKISLVVLDIQCKTNLLSHMDGKEIIDRKGIRLFYEIKKKFSKKVILLARNSINKDMTERADKFISKKDFRIDAFKNNVQSLLS